MPSDEHSRPDRSPSDEMRAARHREIMANFGGKALQGGDFAALLQEACQLTAEGVGVEHAKILEYRPETDDLIVRAGVGWAENVVGRATLSAGMSSPPGSAFRTDRPVFIEDCARSKEFEYSDLLRAHDVHALVNVPIKLDGFIFGVLEADSNAPRRFSADDRNFLAGFANLVAAAVERQRHDADLAAAAKERDQLLAELQQAKEAAEAASASKSRLLAAAGHDLKQPLQSIVTSLDLMADRLTDPVDQKRAQRAMRAAGTLERALDRLLALSHLESGTVEPRLRNFALGPLLADIAETLRPVAEAKGLQLRLTYSGARIRSDADLLEEILQNIVNNAIKYTEKGRVLIGCRARGDNLSIEVHDTGIGMREDEIETAFQEFRRLDGAHGGGVGLGLSIVRRLADLLDHPLSVRSQPGKGTCFAIEVPRPDVPPAASN